MIVVKTVEEMKALIGKSEWLSVGFVPTMGALHEGHLSLIKESKRDNQITVVSIFVNPTQFNDPADFRNYPREVEKDKTLLEKALVDYLFLPSKNEIYPKEDLHSYDLGGVQNHLEGKFRPGHFNGVASVVKRLFDVVKPTKAYFGLKDFQQFQVIKKLNENYNLGVEIIGCETLREDDGLAMSSRNKRLTDAERILAANLSKALKLVAEKGTSETSEKLEEIGKLFLSQYSGINLEYFKVLDPESLIGVNPKKNPGSRIALLAAKIGDVRLIDNMMI
ncbi:MAG: pantoate--beta-alanine ligase [Flavobacteriales bacterium]|nr:pantoate--beta-alanine ligase [Flavobacteriales bacterium]